MKNLVRSYLTFPDISGSFPVSKAFHAEMLAPSENGNGSNRFVEILFKKDVQTTLAMVKSLVSRGYLIRSFDLTQYKLGRLEPEHFAPYLADLRILRISGCHSFDDEGIAVIAPYCKKLQSLSIGNVQITDKGLFQIVSGCKVKILDILT